MDPQARCGHNPDRPTRRRLGLGNIRVHSRPERRESCTTRGRTFAEIRATPLDLTCPRFLVQGSCECGIGGHLGVGRGERSSPRLGLGRCELRRGPIPQR